MYMQCSNHILINEIEYEEYICKTQQKSKIKELQK